MKKMLSLAAVIVAMSAGGAVAELPELCSGNKTGWNAGELPVGGEPQPPVCYTGGSGNEVDCDRSGNLVQVTSTSASDVYSILTNPGGTQTCLVSNIPVSTTPGSCVISRTNDTGSTDFDYCDE